MYQGVPGSGKTTNAVNLIDYMLKNNKFYKINVIALTKSVIQNFSQKLQ